MTANGPAGNTAVLTFPNVWQKNLPSPNEAQRLLLDHLVVLGEHAHDVRDQRRGGLRHLAQQLEKTVMMIQHDMYQARRALLIPVHSHPDLRREGRRPDAKLDRFAITAQRSSGRWLALATCTALRPAVWTSSPCSRGWRTTAGTCRRASLLQQRDQLRLRDLQHGRGGREVPGHRILHCEQSLNHSARGPRPRQGMFSWRRGSRWRSTPFRSGGRSGRRKAPPTDRPHRCPP